MGEEDNEVLALRNLGGKKAGKGMRGGGDDHWSYEAVGKTDGGRGRWKGLRVGTGCGEGALT